LGAILSILILCTFSMFVAHIKQIGLSVLQSAKRYNPIPDPSGECASASMHIAAIYPEETFSRNWPQAAEMSLPRDSRTGAVKWLSSRIF